MFTRVALLAALLSIVPFAGGCGPSGPGVGANIDSKVKAEELAALSGTWLYERQVVEGKEINVAEMSKSHIIFNGETFTREVNASDGRRINGIRGTLWVDPTTTPKQFDHDHPGFLGKKRRPGIYKLEGDRLTLCWNNSTAERPQSFDSPPGSSFVLSVLKRQGAK